MVGRVSKEHAATEIVTDQRGVPDVQRRQQSRYRFVRDCARNVIVPDRRRRYTTIPFREGRIVVLEKNRGVLQRRGICNGVVT
jgi:hypothetical protein